MFIFEAVLKMYAVGVKEYFHHRWNIFDFVIIFVSTLYSVLSAFVQSCSRTSERARASRVLD